MSDETLAELARRLGIAAREAGVLPSEYVAREAESARTVGDLELAEMLDRWAAILERKERE